MSTPSQVRSLTSIYTCEHMYTLNAHVDWCMLMHYILFAYLVPNYCFKDEEAIGSEPSGVLRFTIENTGTPEAACVMFTTSDGSANGV